MSEKKSIVINTELPADLEHFDNLDMMTYANGAKHVYGVDSEGKKSHISADDVIRAYGYDPADRPPQVDTPEPGPISIPNPTPPEGYRPPEPSDPENTNPFNLDPADQAELNEIKTDLTLAEHDYAKKTAKSRKSYVGRFLSEHTRTGKLLRKSDKLSSALDKLQFDKKTVQAKEKYEELNDQYGSRLAELLYEKGLTEEQVLSLATSGNILRNDRLENMIVFERQAQSKNTNKFVNWWVKSGGWKHKAKKAGVVLGAGLLAGTGVGLAALPGYMAVLAGGGAGAGIARHVTRRRANAIGENGKTITVNQSEDDRFIAQSSIMNNYNRGEFSDVLDTTNTVEDRTDSEMLGNRKRMRTAVGLGATAAKAGFMLGTEARKLGENFFNKDGDPTGKGGGPETGDTGSGKPEPGDPIPEGPRGGADTPQSPELQGTSFNVEYGNGFIHEIQDFAQANGHSVDSSKAFQIYNEAVAKFGKDGLIESGTYVRKAGDIGISSPGQTSWKPGVAEFINSRLQ